MAPLENSLLSYGEEECTSTILIGVLDGFDQFPDCWEKSKGNRFDGHCLSQSNFVQSLSENECTSDGTEHSRACPRRSHVIGFDRECELVTLTSKNVADCDDEVSYMCENELVSQHESLNYCEAVATRNNKIKKEELENVNVPTRNMRPKACESRRQVPNYDIICYSDATYKKSCLRGKGAHLCKGHDMMDQHRRKAQETIAISPRDSAIEVKLFPQQRSVQFVESVVDQVQIIPRVDETDVHKLFYSRKEMELFRVELSYYEDPEFYHDDLTMFCF